MSKDDGTRAGERSKRDRTLDSLRGTCFHANSHDSNFVKLIALVCAGHKESSRDLHEENEIYKHDRSVVRILSSGWSECFQLLIPRRAEIFTPEGYVLVNKFSVPF